MTNESILSTLLSLANQAEYGLTNDEVVYILKNGGYWVAYMTNVDYKEYARLFDTIGGFVYEDNPVYKTIDNWFNLESKYDYEAFTTLVLSFDIRDNVEFYLIIPFEIKYGVVKKMISLPYHWDDVNAIGYHEGQPIKLTTD